MIVYNTLSGQKEEFQPMEQNKVRMFVCGPTVYDVPHLGHAKTYVLFDAFAKYLRHKNFEVQYLQNITDIDDKIIARATEEDTDYKSIAEKYTKIYFEDMKALGVDAVSQYAPATEYIDEIVDQVKRLVDTGHSYFIEGDGYYFDLATFPEYGKLSGRTSQQAEDSISRIDESVNKRNPGDFALWKLFPADAGHEEIGWDSPLGRGRPGWHIEDTAITEKVFGPQYDIHGGGVDIKFPHHEAEIAQQESVSGKSPLAKYWMHVGSLTVNGKKMSKSLGNFVTIKDVLKQISPQAARLYILSGHYRSPLDYNDTLLDQSDAASKRIAGFSARLGQARGTGNKKTEEYLKEGAEGFYAALNDDFNTPGALGAVFELIRNVNPILVSNELSESQAGSIKTFLNTVHDVLGIIPEPEDQEIPDEILALAEQREEARKNKNWAEADRLRAQIESQSYTISDTPAGPLVSLK